MQSVCLNCGGVFATNRRARQYCSTPCSNSVIAQDWQHAIEIEATIRAVHPDVYLHRSLVPLAEVELKLGWLDIIQECTAPGVACWA